MLGTLDDSQMEISLFKDTGADRQSIKMLEIVFPCSIQHFYDFFLADEAELYGRKKHLESRKAHTIQCSKWVLNEELQAETREVTAVIKVNGVPLLKEARMSQVWMLTRKDK